VKKYTYSAKRSDKVDKWYIVDAEGVVLGRLATVFASRLGGKYNPLFTPHVDENFVSKLQATAAIEPLATIWRPERIS
jgi:hypothetical protein